ncbi:MAG: ABC transporter substrate-binding protein [Proteobacteria bacterium]|nr:ABC transporter substrate-binding protein [Pseudomonadota bacterium]
MKGRSKINRGLVCLAILVLTAAFICACNENDDNVTARQGAQPVEIGGIVGLTGGSPVWGRSCLRALRYAEADVNADLAAQGAERSVSLVYADSALLPVVADYLMRSFVYQGIRVVVGPLTSSELLTMQTEVNASGSIVISPSSTLPQLSTVGDNILRMVPNDNVMIDAIVQALLLKGIRSLAVMYNDDDWGTAILNNLKTAFEGKGGTVIGSRNYANLRPDILQGGLDDLSALIAAKIAADGAGTVGFLLISYDEGQGILNLAAADPVLGQVRWFGTDGYVGRDDLLTDATAAPFCAQTEYMAPSLKLTLTAKGEALKAKVEAATGLPATIYSLLAYDAFYVAAKALVNSPRDIGVGDLRNRILAEFRFYQGTTGTIDLNAAGDRASGVYYFWQVKNNAGTYEWQHVLTYENGGVS